MIFLKISHGNRHGIILLISHTIVFITALYIASHSSYMNLFPIYYKNNLTSMKGGNKTSVNISNKISFFDLGMKYQADKVTEHRYDKMYEKYLQKYIGTNVSILEIGLGCDMIKGPGASAYLWRDYLGPQADIHFIEYDKNCGETWYRIHGVKVKEFYHFDGFFHILILAKCYNALW